MKPVLRSTSSYQATLQCLKLCSFLLGQHCRFSRRNNFESTDRAEVSVDRLLSFDMLRAWGGFSRGAVVRAEDSHQGKKEGKARQGSADQAIDEGLSRLASQREDRVWMVLEAVDPSSCVGFDRIRRSRMACGSRPVSALYVRSLRGETRTCIFARSGPDHGGDGCAMLSVAMYVCTGVVCEW